MVVASPHPYRSVRRLPGPFAAVVAPVSTSHRVSLPTLDGYSSRSQPVFVMSAEYVAGGSGRQARRLDGREPRIWQKFHPGNVMSRDGTDRGQIFSGGRIRARNGTDSVSKLPQRSTGATLANFGPSAELEVFGSMAGSDRVAQNLARSCSSSPSQTPETGSNEP